jgi:hypothetical protein
MDKPANVGVALMERDDRLYPLLKHIVGRNLRGGEESMWFCKVGFRRITNWPSAIATGTKEKRPSESTLRMVPATGVMPNMDVACRHLVDITLGPLPPT